VLGDCQYEAETLTTDFYVCNTLTKYDGWLHQVYPIPRPGQLFQFSCGAEKQLLKIYAWVYVVFEK